MVPSTRQISDVDSAFAITSSVPVSLNFVSWSQDRGPVWAPAAPVNNNASNAALLRFAGTHEFRRGVHPLSFLDLLKLIQYIPDSLRSGRNFFCCNISGCRPAGLLFRLQKELFTDSLIDLA